MITVSEAYEILFNIALIILGGCLIAALLRSVLGPTISDRILAINMIGTVVIASISILANLLDEDWLYDICLVYVLISFLSVATLATVYIRNSGKGGKHK